MVLALKLQQTTLARPLEKINRLAYNLSMNIEEIKKKIKYIFPRNNVVFAGVFGSYARNEAKKNSDIDILVRFGRPVSLLDMGGLQVDLTEALNKNVDVVTEEGLHPKIRKNVLNDLKVVYEK